MTNKKTIFFAVLSALVLVGQVPADLIDFGTSNLGTVAVYDEDNFRFTAIDNGLGGGGTNHFDIHDDGSLDASLALHGTNGNAEVVRITAIDNSLFSLISFGAGTSDVNLWEVVSSSAGSFTLPTGEKLYDTTDFGSGFQNVTSITFRSQTIPLNGSESLGLDLITLNSVPEPSSFAFAGLGCLCLIGRRKRG